MSGSFLKSSIHALLKHYLLFHLSPTISLRLPQFSWVSHFQVKTLSLYMFMGAMEVTHVLQGVLPLIDNTEIGFFDLDDV
jgi:hypothetical protein